MLLGPLRMLWRLLKMEVKDIKANLNKPVIFDNSIYTLTGSTIRKNNDGEIYYTAEILGIRFFTYVVPIAHSALPTISRHIHVLD